MIGIPQGSVLSSILCAFFYGDMEKGFTKFTKDLNSVYQILDLTNMDSFCCRNSCV